MFRTWKDRSRGRGLAPWLRRRRPFSCPLAARSFFQELLGSRRSNATSAGFSGQVDHGPWRQRVELALLTIGKGGWLWLQASSFPWLPEPTLALSPPNL